LKMPPSDYFRRQCLISGRSGRIRHRRLVEHLGRVLHLGLDYPHIDARSAWCTN